MMIPLMETTLKSMDKQVTSTRILPESNVMALPYDVLFELFPWLWQRGEISILMRTCKTMYKYGVRALLDGPVYIEQETFPSLYRFLKADMSRCKFLHELFLDSVPDRQQCNIFLARILRQATDVRKLHITSRVFNSHPHVLSALRDMKTIEELDLPWWNYGVSMLLSTTKSPIQKLRVYFSPEQTDSKAPIEWVDWHEPAIYTEFLFYLSDLMDELEEVHVEWVKWLEMPEGVVFTKVHTLHIANCQPFYIRPLVTAFPNVRKLHIRLDDNMRNDLHGFDLDAMRSVNISKQADSGTWRYLDDAHFDSGTLYMLAPICKIRTLRTDCPCEEISPNDWQSALATIQPENFHLDIEPELAFDGMRDLLTRIPTSVVRLTLEIDMSELELGWRESVFDTLGDWLAHLVSLTHVSFVFQWMMNPGCDEFHDMTDVIAELKYSLTSYPRLALAQQLAEKILSLNYVHIDIRPAQDAYPWNGEFWAVETVESKRSLTQLSSSEGLRAMQWR